ncbi:MAG: UvrD-helicase domain-containing protein, partial [Rhodospirillales bacterium]
MPDSPPSPPVSYLDGLNEAQREAVEATEGPVLVLAGAGTGKTRVLIARLVHILSQGKARPWEVLAVTFTNKAAGEMKERASRLLAGTADDWWVGTFHSMGARILRANAEAVGLGSDFTILDDDDQVRLVKQLLKDRRIDEKRWPARAVAGVIQRWKDLGLAPGQVPADEDSEAADGQALEVYSDYQKRLKELNAADFGDLLLHCLTLFRGHPEILAKY